MKRSITFFVLALGLMMVSPTMQSQDKSAAMAEDQKGEKYYIAVMSDMDFESTVEQVKANLKEAGFGVVSEIDMQAKLKKGADKDIPKYLILGACNPAGAYKAMQEEERIGVMLPCNVIVRETREGEIEVAAINPRVTMKSLGNPNMTDLANDIGDKLEKALQSL